MFFLFLPKSEDKMHLGIKNEQAHFILLSVCIIFVANEKDSSINFMTNVINKINSLYPLSDDTLQILKENVTICHFPKKYKLIEANKFCKSAYFIEKGMTRSFWLVNGEEITILPSYAKEVVISSPFTSQKERVIPFSMK